MSFNLTGHKVVVVLQAKSRSDQDVYNDKLLLLNLAKKNFSRVRYCGFLETALPVDRGVYGFFTSPHPGQRIKKYISEIGEYHMG